MKKNSIILFNQKKVRRYWDENKELWYFSIVDVVAILTKSINPQAYWRKLKERLKKEGNESVTNCHALKMQAADGKMRFTRCCRYRTAFTINSIYTISQSRKKRQIIISTHSFDLLSDRKT